MYVLAYLTFYTFRLAMQCIAQPNMTLLDCILYLEQFFYDPGIVSGKPVHPWNVYLRTGSKFI